MLFLFIDGVGLRPPAADNPVNAEVCPSLCRLFERSTVPCDACLGVGGPPQSATGQATMFTGENAPMAMGRHCEGFPGPSLRKLIEKRNVFTALRARGLRVRFADAYLVDSPDQLSARRFKSVTTVMSLTAPETISTESDLRDNAAVMQDITRETIQDRYPDIPAISPETAAEHLFGIARANDFTLFEFFQSDIAGHSMDYSRACAVLRLFDRFLSVLLRFSSAAGITLVLTSDHGNIENMSERGHTRNPVPFSARGPGAAGLLASVRTLADVTPAILAAFSAKPPADAFLSSVP